MPRKNMPAGPGRPKGLANKSTIEFKEAVNNLITYATPKMQEWLETIAATNPEKALDHVYKFAQFGYPLLARTEMANAPGEVFKTEEQSVAKSDAEIIDRYLANRPSKDYSENETTKH